MSEEPQGDDVLSYRPSAGYYRRALRDAKTIKRARSVGLSAVDEYERLRAWVREQGLIPPKWRVLREEAEDKEWAEKSG
jgi:hypothetical protein